MKVLLIDDEKELVSTLAERLSLRGIQTDWATSGEQGVAKATSNDYDCVMIDLMMPGMDGRQVTEKVRRANADTKIILITGHSSPQDRSRAAKLGVEHYLIKPVDIDDLVSILREEED